MKKIFLMLTITLFILFLPVQIKAQEWLKTNMLVTNANHEQIIDELVELSVMQGWDIGYKNSDKGLMQIKIYTSEPPTLVKEALKCGFLLGDFSEIRWKIGIKVTDIGKDSIISYMPIGGIGKGRFIRRLKAGLIAKGFTLYSGYRARNYYYKTFNPQDNLTENNENYLKQLFKKTWRGYIEDEHKNRYKASLKYKDGIIYMKYKGVKFPGKNIEIKGNNFNFSLYTTNENRIMDIKGTIKDNVFEGVIKDPKSRNRGTITVKRGAKNRELFVL